MSNNNNSTAFCFSETLGSETWVCIDGWNFKIENTGTNRLKNKKQASGGNGELTAPMPGQILKMLVKNGQEVNEGDSLFIVEAMKMEHTLKAPYAGVVTDLVLKDGDTVSGADIILKIKKDA
ncbi:MAG: acetyl-CoA carboxylase biotin carboxyl carrier protein subunit [Bdellovibrionales bacterium]